MKHIYLLVLLLLSSFDVFSQTSRTSTSNPSRTVLYTCGANEDFYECEYFSNMKVVGNKFACITKNKANSKYSLILNGETVISAKDLFVDWVDLSSKNGCIYKYSNNEKEYYMVIEGQSFGPYEDLCYGNSFYGKLGGLYNWDGTPNLSYYFDKYSFDFTLMGKNYHRDNDGSIYDSEEMAQTPIYSSYNGKHKARLTTNYRLLTFDDKNYVLPIDIDIELKKSNIEGAYVTNEGEFIILILYFQQSGWRDRRFLIKNDELIEFADDEYFDITSRTVSVKTPNMPARQPSQLGNPYGWRLINDDTWKVGIDIHLQDKTNKHFFISNWNYDYVMIDNKKYGKTTPITAFYDDVNNAFGWVCIEGKQLVLYSFKL